VSQIKKSFYQLTHSALSLLLKENDFNPSGANLLFNWHYKKKQSSPCITDLSKETRNYLKEKFDFSLPKIDQAFISKDKTVKFLFELKDGNKVETVLIPFKNRYSICLSSQVGCAMKCSFCFTGTQGFKRNLSTDEIVGQYLEVYRWLELNRPEDGKILNIVFMGQGEPLHNFDSVADACEILLSQAGSSVGNQKITISTSGYLPGLKRWVEEVPGVNLALSLHSPIKEKRDELIPINKNYPLQEVMSVIRQIPLRKKQFVIFEYLLIDEFNDKEEDAHATAELILNTGGHINLIPFNPFPGSKYKRPALEKVEAFQQILETYKIPTMIRTTKGDDVLAACGQLKT
jgi:23S rRNA (adenine2503-C2)-methyltransferase